MAPKKLKNEKAEEESYSYVTDEEEAPPVTAAAAKAEAAKAVAAKAVAAKAAGSGAPRAIPAKAAPVEPKAIAAPEFALLRQSSLNLLPIRQRHKNSNGEFGWHP